MFLDIVKELEGESLCVQEIDANQFGKLLMFFVKSFLIFTELKIILKCCLNVVHFIFSFVIVCAF